MAEYGTRLGNSQDTAPRVRATDALSKTGVTAVRARPGVRNDGGGAVSVVNGTMTVQVSPFSCWVDAGSVSQVGFPFVLDATKTLTIDPGHATLIRVDTIAVVADSSTPTTASVQVVKGTPGAGAPVLPTYAVALRDISVPAGASAGTGGLSGGALSTDRRNYLAHGVIRVAGQTERDALVPQPGWAVYRADTKVIEVYNGTGWDVFKPVGGTGVPFARAAGSVALTFSNTNQATAVVNFPAGRFSVPPLVQQSVQGAGSSAITAIRMTGAPTSSSYTAVVNTSANFTGTVTIGWEAVQMTPTTADG